MGPPSSGGVAVLQILGLLEHFDMAQLGPTTDGMQALLEASKLAFADRNLYLADTDFVRVPVRGPARPGLPDDAGAADPAGCIPRQGRGRQSALARGRGCWLPTRARSCRAPASSSSSTRRQRPVDDHDDRERLRQRADGRRVPAQQRADRLLLRCRRTDGRPVANRVEGGKRPRSSMAPTIVFDARARRPADRLARAAARSSATWRRRWWACWTGA